MKRIVLTAFALLTSVLVFGQGRYGADSAECVKYLSFYQQYVKQGDLEGAAPSWRNAIKFCPPTASQNMLLDGMKIMRKEIGKYRSNPIRKKELVDTLMMLHQLRIDNYPQYAVTAITNRAVDMMNYAETGSEQVVFDALGEAMDVAKEKTSTTIAVRYMNYAVQLYKLGRLVDQDVFDAFDKSISTLEAVENIFAQSGVASCDNLVAVFQPRYDASNTELLKNMLALFHSAGCTDLELFSNALEDLNKMEPSVDYSYQLFRLFSSHPDGADKAIMYMQQAIDSDESDVETDAQYYYEAVAAAKQAASLSQAYAGKAYFLIGTIWSVSKCDGNEIESRAHYWVATDYMIKARNADSSLAEEANKQIATYSQYYPEQSTAFMYDMVDGNRYEVSCNGLSESTTVRTQK